MSIERDDHRLGGKLLRRQVRAETARVDVDGVAPRRLDDLDAGGEEAFPHVGGGPYAVAQIVGVEHLAQAHR